MDPLVKAAIERIGDAIYGRALSGYTAIRAEDVVAVCAAVKPDKQTGTVKAMLKGAANSGTLGEIHQRTDHLAHLLEMAK